MSRLLTVNCKYCRSEIDPRATICPHCRRKQGGSGCLVAILWGILIIAGGFVALVMLSVVFPNTTQMVENKAAATNQGTAQPKITKEQFITQCGEYDYKSLMRNPEQYKGKKIKITLGINQTIDSMFTFNDHCYRAMSKTEFGWYGDEYALIDCRPKTDTKILNNDIVNIYGVYAGDKQIERALTKTYDEIPTIEIYYADVIGDTDVTK